MIQLAPDVRTPQGPTELVVNFTSISVHIELLVILELGLTAETVNTHCEISVLLSFSATHTHPTLTPS